MDVGNKVLQIFAQRLKECSPKWQVFRVSADVFGLYIDDSVSMNLSIEDKVYNLRKRLMFESIKIDDYIIDLNITISIAFGKNALHNAFAALNMAKENQVGYMIFTSEEEFKKKIEYNKKWQKEIKYAIEENRIEPFFQPIVDKKGNVVKYECLMRMKKVNGDEVEYIPPFFLDIAIKTKQYLTISKQMIEKTFIYFRNGGEFNINLSYIDMQSESMRDLLEYLITTYNAQGRVTFEILEDESIKDYHIIEEFISYFKKYGVKIAIDDFGSGYSNFKRIMSINPDYIKFDGSLIKNINTDKYSYLIVQNLVNFAKSLNIKTVAEYVHNKDVFDTCVYLGVDYLQGYYISAPKKDIV
jgi:EAL domain-containing protein (putative c-di-GMP-specific phosphodiesterase class I)